VFVKEEDVGGREGGREGGRGRGRGAGFDLLDRHRECA